MAIYRKDSPQFLEFLETATLEDIQIMPIYGLTISEKIKAFQKLIALKPETKEVIDPQIEDLKKLYPDDEKYMFRVIEPA